MNSFRGVAWLAGSLVEAKNHLVEDLIGPALGVRRWNAALAESSPAWHGFASFPSDKNPISTSRAPERTRCLPSWRGKTLIESPIKCRKLPPPPSGLNRVAVSEKHSTNFPSFDYAQLAEAPLWIWIFPQSRARLNICSLLLLSLSLSLRLVSLTARIYIRFNSLLSTLGSRRAT